ncbi:MAG: class I SAM-dependent methyltransferase [Fibrobacterota bacterium]|nr:class I SAM-dependent methyltransferase [Fibrobacterota bacterium]
MLSNNTDKEWEKFGKDDPYFGVLSDETFRKGKLDATALDLFFASGRDYVDSLFRSIEAFTGNGFRPDSALDFGCGVGRLVIPLAAKCGRVAGVDVSPSMLAEARENCVRMKVANADFHDSLAEAGAAAKFDLVNSYIVFQHIPPDRGYGLFRELIGLLTPGGVGAVQVTFAIHTTRMKRAAGWLRRRFQPFNMLINLAKGKPFNAPFMQMNGYRLNDLLAAVQETGCEEVRLSLTSHQGHSGAVLMFRKPTAG